MTRHHISHSAAIDVIKGLAIVSVIFLHTLSTRTLNQTAAVFHIEEAVPVFLFLMGLNGASSFRRRGGRSLRELYTASYLASRLDRIAVPFVIAFTATALLALATHKVGYTPTKLAGYLFTAQLPISGPGNYFIALLFQAALLFPAVYWGLRRWPLGTLMLCLAIDVAFEILAPRTSFIASHPYAYEVSLARYLFLLALGGLCAGAAPARLLSVPWLRCGALVSVAYLVFLLVDPAAIPFGELGWSSQAFAAAFYPAFLVVLGIRVLPAVANGPIMRGLAGLGRASYHVFLVQIAWFGLSFYRQGSLLALAGNLVVTLPLGMGFYLAMKQVPLSRLGELIAQRRPAPAEPGVENGNKGSQIFGKNRHAV